VARTSYSNMLSNRLLRHCCQARFSVLWVLVCI